MNSNISISSLIIGEAQQQTLWLNDKCLPTGCFSIVINELTLGFYPEGLEQSILLQMSASEPINVWFEFLLESYFLAGQNEKVSCSIPETDSGFIVFQMKKIALL